MSATRYEYAKQQVKEGISHGFFLGMFNCTIHSYAEIIEGITLNASVLGMILGGTMLFTAVGKGIYSYMCFIEHHPAANDVVINIEAYSSRPQIEMPLLQGNIASVASNDSDSKNELDFANDPVSLEPMIDPILIKNCGHTLDRTTLSKLSDLKCPCCRTEITQAVPNFKFKEAIEYIKNQGLFAPPSQPSVVSKNEEIVHSVVAPVLHQSIRSS